MTKQIARWKPAKWSPARMGAKEPLFPESITIPTETLIGAGAGFVGGLVLEKPVSSLLNVSPPMATGILGGMSLGAALGIPYLPKNARNILYGLAGGFFGAAALRLVQTMFTPPAAPVAPKP